MSIYIIWSIGLLASLGFPGFVRADDMKHFVEVQKTDSDAIQDLNRRSLEWNLISARSVQCRAPDKRFATQRLLTLEYEYAHTFGTPWPAPDCNELTSTQAQTAAP